MTKVALQQWHPCEICGAQTTSQYCSVCVRETPPPLLEAYTDHGQYTIRLRTGEYLTFFRAFPRGDFALLYLEDEKADKKEFFVRVSDIIWSQKR